jgi:hypothetical protein
MPLPEPKEDEEEQEFVSRCIGEVSKTDPDRPQNQIIAICYSQWRKKSKSESESESEEFKELSKTTVLLGDEIFNGGFYPAEEIAKAFKTMEGKPLILDHSKAIEDEIGFVKDVKYCPKVKKMTVIPVINLSTPKSRIALSYIECRMKAGQIPEVSVGVFVDSAVEMIGGEEKLVCRNLEFDHLALVTRGACGPSSGCGIGLSTKENKKLEVINMEDNESELADWTVAFINDLPDSSFAVIEPAYERGETENKQCRHLPFKDASGKIDLPHLRNALARWNQIKPVTDSISTEELRKKAQAVLERAAEEAGIGGRGQEEKEEEPVQEAEEESPEIIEPAVEEPEVEVEVEVDNSRNDEIKMLHEENEKMKNELEHVKKQFDDLMTQMNEIKEKKGISKTLSKEEEIKNDINDQYEKLKKLILAKKR